jgi:hypothetical protein
MQSSAGSIGSSAAGHSMIATLCASCGERVQPITCQPIAM